MSAIRARRHPGAIAGLWLWQTALALIAALPAASFADAAFGAHPRSDAPLWDPGGHVLLDFLRRAGPGLAPVTTIAAVVLVLGAIIGLLPSAAVMFAMNSDAPDAPGAPTDGPAAPPDGVRLPRSFARSRLALGLAAARFPAFVRLLATVSALQAAVLGAGGVAGTIAADRLADAIGAARADEAGALLLALSACAAAVLGVAQDLARAVLVRGGEPRALTAFALGWRALRRARWRVAWGWGWRELAGILPVLAAAALAERIGGQGGLALVVLSGAHQGVIALRAALRASWLAYALRTVA